MSVCYNCCTSEIFWSSITVREASRVRSNIIGKEKLHRRYWEVVVISREKGSFF